MNTRAKVLDLVPMLIGLVHLGMLLMYVSLLDLVQEMTVGLSILFV